MVVTQHIGKDSHAQQRSTNVRYVTNLGILPANVFKRSSTIDRHINNLNHIRYKIDEPHSYLHDYSSESSSSKNSFCLQVKVQKQTKKTQKPSKTTHLLTNIVYRLKPHHTRNKYLQAWIDTGAGVNLMPVSIYKLVYQDNNLRKLNPCNLKIGTYTADSIKIIGMMVIYLIHPDSKQPTKTTFHIASSKGSVLLSCNASLQLGLIHHRP